MTASDNNLSTTIHKVNHLRKFEKMRTADHLEGFTQIEPYLASLKQLNSGLQYRVDKRNNSIEMERIIIIPQYSAYIIPFSYNIVAVDGAHMKDIIDSRQMNTYLEKMHVLIVGI